MFPAMQTLTTCMNKGASISVDRIGSGDRGGNRRGYVFKITTCDDAGRDESPSTYASYILCIAAGRTDWNMGVGQEPVGVVPEDRPRHRIRQRVRVRSPSLCLIDLINKIKIGKPVLLKGTEYGKYTFWNTLLAPSTLLTEQATRRSGPRLIFEG